MQSNRQRLEQAEKEFNRSLSQMLSSGTEPTTNVNELLCLSQEIKHLHFLPQYKTQEQDVHQLQEKLEQHIVQLKQHSDAAEKLVEFSAFGRFLMKLVAAFFLAIGIFFAYDGFHHWWPPKGVIYYSFHRQLYFWIFSGGALIVSSLLWLRLRYSTKVLRIIKDVKKLIKKAQCLLGLLNETSNQLEYRLNKKETFIISDQCSKASDFLQETVKINRSIIALSKKPFVCKLAQPRVLAIWIVLVALAGIISTMMGS